jgi:hypothetical protein
MIIDLDSWEAGYDDGLRGRPSQCTPGLDRLSYSSGYFQARATRAGMKERRRLSSTQPIPDRHGGLGHMDVLEERSTMLDRSIPRGAGLGDRALVCISGP